MMNLPLSALHSNLDSAGAFGVHASSLIWLTLSILVVLAGPPLGALWTYFLEFKPRTPVLTAFPGVREPGSNERRAA